MHALSQSPQGLTMRHKKPSLGGEGFKIGENRKTLEVVFWFEDLLAAINAGLQVDMVRTAQLT